MGLTAGLLGGGPLSPIGFELGLDADNFDRPFLAAGRIGDGRFDGGPCPGLLLGAGLHLVEVAGHAGPAVDRQGALVQLGGGGKLLSVAGRLGLRDQLLTGFLALVLPLGGAERDGLLGRGESGRLRGGA